MDEVYSDFGPKDQNEYDDVMLKIVDRIWAKLAKSGKPYGSFYLIGVPKGGDAKRILKHEIAHGLYSTNIEYKTAMDNQLKLLPPIKLKKLKSIIGRDYAKRVIIDECQAYMSTGLTEETEKLKFTKSELDSFRKIFRRFTKKK